MVSQWLLDLVEMVIYRMAGRVWTFTLMWKKRLMSVFPFGEFEYLPYEIKSLLSRLLYHFSHEVSNCHDVGWRKNFFFSNVMDVQILIFPSSSNPDSEDTIQRCPTCCCDPWCKRNTTVTPGWRSSLVSLSQSHNPPDGHTQRGQFDGQAEVGVTPPSAERGPASGLSRRRACRRWTTAPPAGWPFEPSRRTPRATGSWRVRRGGMSRGCGGTSRSVPSACRRGAPARPWAGKGTL